MDELKDRQNGNQKKFIIERKDQLLEKCKKNGQRIYSIPALVDCYSLPRKITRFDP